MVNDNYCFTFLDSENPLEVELYERAMYRAFPVTRAEFQSTKDPYYIYNHETKRISKKLSYSQQKIFIYRPAERIISSVTINSDMQKQLQLEMEGFCIEKTDGVCEALSLFNFGDTVQFKIFMEDVMRYLKTEKIVKIYGTCNDKNLKPYMNLGFQHEASHEKSHLISITI